MLKEIVNAILPSHLTKTHNSKKISYENRANFRKRRILHKEERRNDVPQQLSKFMDDAQTHEIKTTSEKTVKRYRIPTLLSFLIFYVCVFNVIITCDVSLSSINLKTLKQKRAPDANEFIRDGLKYSEPKNKLFEKVIQKETKDVEEEEENEEEQYSNPVAELSKYYHYFKNKEDFANLTNKEIPDDFYDVGAIGYPHDLTSSPYHIKKTNFTLRPETHQFHMKILKLGVLLPADPNAVFSLVKVLPIIEKAIPAMTKDDGPLPNWQILVDYRDTRCSSVDGPLAAFEFYINGSADAFIGPGCEYVIGPVARYAGLWGIPVLTAGAQAEAFGHKHPGYMTLTRMMGSYTQAAVAIWKVFEEFNWSILGMLYHNNDISTGIGNSPCFLTLSAVYTVLQKENSVSTIQNIGFDETNTTTAKIKELLQKLSLKTRSEYVKRYMKKNAKCFI